MTGHPRLYFTATELKQMRALRTKGVHARIWRNLRASATECLSLSPRREWIAPVSPDPVYENLYDRFYAIMGDLAVTEHLAFAYAYSGERRFGDAAKAWVLASCRAWQREADGEPDGGKAYAVCRLLKGLAVGYDCLYPILTAAERDEIRETLVRIGQRYFDGYFRKPEIAGPAFHTHHAIVEWASFGVAALALLGEHPAAEAWLDATVRKFEEHLLPKGLAPDGAQVEGATFWASTMQYRLFFMDPLRRVTGRDLFKAHATSMNADLALASIAAEKRAGHDENHQTVVMEPSYGQLNYYAPVLLALAREYRRPIYQHLALWDRTLGALQETRYITPNGEQLRFEMGGYAYAWYDATVPATPGDASKQYHFPSVDEAYLRASWKPGDLLVGVRRGQLVVHAGGIVVLAETGATPEAAMSVRTVRDDGRVGVIECADATGQATLTVTLERPGRVAVRRSGTGGRPPLTFWSQVGAERDGDTWRWRAAKHRVTMTLTRGSVTTWEPEGYSSDHSVGNGRLKLRDPAPRLYPSGTVAADATGTLEIEVVLEPRR